MKFPVFRRSYVASSLLLLGALLPAVAAQPQEIRLTIDSVHPTAQFDPQVALGGGIDGHRDGEVARMLSPENVRQILRAGLGPVSFRLRTELGVEAWHWNPRGTWSDPRHQQGYWTSSATPQRDRPILLSYGYKLPRRGDTHDEANDDGYSMLDDGDAATFWKSNPYLASQFTGEPDAHHPAWVLIDFEKPVPLNAIRIHWADPYATHFDVEYADSGCVYFGQHPRGVWHRFENGRITRGTGGAPLSILSKDPIKARYLRIWMTEGSGTAATGSKDVRDRLGYAIREIEAGWRDAAGVFHDQVHHSANQRQTITYVSSTDPWHRASDRDRQTEQPGIDLVFRSGITRGLPTMLAVPVLYGTPEDAIALAAYMRRANHPIARFELGEEPDGQRVDPRDFAVLYAQVARGIRHIEPHAILGGPSFMTGDADYLGLLYRDWLRRFRRALADRGQAGDFQFLSFESYPFDDVWTPEAGQLAQAPGKLAGSMRHFSTEHLPIILGEYNYSAYFTEHEVDLGGAMLNAETVAQFLCSGGQAAYFYGCEPDALNQTTGSWGRHVMLLQAKGQNDVTPVATFHALRMISSDWLNPQGGLHQVLRVHSNLPADHFSAFALQRPDGSASLLMINKDPSRPALITLRGDRAFHGAATLVTYSARQYHWYAEGPHGRPTRNEPPLQRTVRADQLLTVPAWSISILRSP
ncbi:discoidin domain-containing protein [Chthoniobacter flavus]|uniref:discoidin domain-containing protein n=1 Tax=Chthoniobacter flavus TaxID=191863 RepID=UPI00104BB9DF|nr:discoidin domain-containing protein [Chthoniobacter flavus]